MYRDFPVPLKDDASLEDIIAGITSQFRIEDCPSVKVPNEVETNYPMIEYESIPLTQDHEYTYQS